MKWIKEYNIKRNFCCWRLLAVEARPSLLLAPSSLPHHLSWSHQPRRLPGGRPPFLPTRTSSAIWTRSWTTLRRTAELPRPRSPRPLLRPRERAWLRAAAGVKLSAVAELSGQQSARRNPRRGKVLLLPPSCRLPRRTWPLTWSSFRCALVTFSVLWIRNFCFESGSSRNKG